MSMTTSLRFETANFGSSMVKSLEREQQRIVKDELTAQRIKDVKLEHDDSLVADWAENLEEASFKKKVKLDQSNMQYELQYWKKSLVAVRRAALQELLEKDHLQYELELHNNGKSFYVKRD